MNVYIQYQMVIGADIFEQFEIKLNMPPTLTPISSRPKA